MIPPEVQVSLLDRRTKKLLRNSTGVIMKSTVQKILAGINTTKDELPSLASQSSQYDMGPYYCDPGDRETINYECLQEI